MSDFQNGVPVTYVTDPPVAAGTAVVAGGTVAVTGIAGAPVEVFGTVVTSVQISGSFSSSIDNVGIKDADGNLAVIPQAQAVKPPTTESLVVQHIDDTGTPLRESTQVAIRALGTNTNQFLADIDLNTLAATTYLAEIANTQGTQSTAVLSTIANQQGTQATSANQTTQISLQTTGNAIATVLMNSQGTQATAANQATEIAALNSVIAQLQANAVNQAGTNLEVTLLSGAYTPQNSASVAVNGYTRFTVQHVVNGSASLQIQTSLDGNNWNLEAVDTASNLQRLTGACKYLRVVYAGGNGTVTSLLNAARDNGGAPTNGSGPAEASFSGLINGTVGSTYTLATNAANSVGFHYEPPTGSWSTFEGSWDGVHWVDITLRQMGAHGYSTRTDDTHQDWIGSVSTFNYIRIRIITGGSGTGSISGKFSFQQNTIEGMENGPMPHRIGAAVEARSFSYSAAISNGTIWAPSTPDHKLYISDIHFTVDANCSVAFCDGSYADNKHIFKGAFKPASGTSQFVPIAFTLPHVFSGANRPLMITVNNTANVEGVVHGYEAE